MRESKEFTGEKITADCESVDSISEADTWHILFAIACCAMQGSTFHEVLSIARKRYPKIGAKFDQLRDADTEGSLEELFSRYE